MGALSPNGRKAKGFAHSEADARARFDRYRNNDPCPTIAPALLNSADILTYVKKTALIYPFNPQRLSGASYDVTIAGDVVYWAPDGGDRVVRKLESKGDFFDLFPNSIAFVTLKPVFQIPNYMALRFNLKISHIYKGLLLGTGPLVDPGFVGRLSIPLHNLTNNTYRFSYGDQLITVEFTKLSPNREWDGRGASGGEGEEKYLPSNIPEKRTVHDYLEKALKGSANQSVISSIPAAMQESQRKIEEAKEEAKKVRDESRFQTVISAVSVIALVAAVIGGLISGLDSINTRYDTLINEYASMRADYESRLSDAERTISELRSEVTQLESVDPEVSP